MTPTGHFIDSFTEGVTIQSTAEEAGPGLAAGGVSRGRNPSSSVSGGGIGAQRLHIFTALVMGVGSWPGAGQEKERPRDQRRGNYVQCNQKTRTTFLSHLHMQIAGLLARLSSISCLQGCKLHSCLSASKSHRALACSLSRSPPTHTAPQPLGEGSESRASGRW